MTSSNYAGYIWLYIVTTVNKISGGTWFRRFKRFQTVPTVIAEWDLLTDFADEVQLNLQEREAEKRNYKRPG